MTDWTCTLARRAELLPLWDDPRRRVIYRGRPDSTNVKCPNVIGRDGWVREGADILNNSPHKVGVETFCRVDPPSTGENGSAPP